MLDRGDLFEQHKGRFVGRRGVIVYVEDDPPSVTLNPAPGSCPCPLKQRRTTINLRRFLAEWRQVS